MEQFVDKTALVAEIEKRMQELRPTNTHKMQVGEKMDRDVLMWLNALTWVKKVLNTLEVKDDMDTIHPIDDVVSNDTLSNPLEISRHRNSHVGETLKEAAENYPSIIRTISPQWESEIERAFIAGTQWQKKQTIEKICKWLEDNVDHYAYNKDFVPNAKECFIKMFRLAEI